MEIITHIPHSSLVIPTCYHNQFIVPFEELKAEIYKLNDHYTDKLFAAKIRAVKPLIFPVNRFLVDPERFESDAHEPMAQRGMGVLYTHDTRGKRFRRELTAAERALLLEKYYRAHHAKLDQLAEQSINKYQQAIIIDCHSFPERPLPCDFNQQNSRPDVCIGTDRVHTPSWLITLVEEQFQRAGLSVLIDTPYAGTIVPNKYFGADKRACSVMIEINRKLYLTSGYEVKKDRMSSLNNTINLIYEQILKRFL